MYKECKGRGKSHEETSMIEQEIEDNIKMNFRNVDCDEWEVDGTNSERCLNAGLSLVSLNIMVV
jgi:hypothetical protein